MLKEKVMRLSAVIMLVLVVLSSAVSCGGNNATQSKDSVTIAISSEPSTLDPTQGWGHGVTPIIQSTLIEYKQDMTFVNDLATEYSCSSDGLIWTFKIREDAKFTDGDSVDSGDVVFTFNTTKNSQSEIDLTYLESSEAVDSHTVRFKLKTPNSTFLNTVASIGIVPEHLYGDDYGINPVGSGAYKFVEWKKGEQLILEANENYYGKVPEIKKVVLVFMSEDTAFAAVKSGEVDVAQVSTSIASSNKVSGYSVKNITTLDNRGFTLPITPNEGKKTAEGYPIGNDVTCNIEIRKALAYGIDREKLAKDAVFGFGDPAFSENDGMPWNNPEVKIVTDVEYAKKLLADNGWVDTDGDGIVEKNGVKAEFKCYYPSSDSVRQAVGLAAAEQAKALGINIILEGSNWDEISKNMFSNAVLMGWGSTDPRTTYYLFHSSNKLNDDYYNPEGFDNKTVDGYLENALTALKTEDAYEYWKKAQWDGTTGTSMKGDCPWVWLVNVQHVYFVRDGIDIGNQMLHAHGASLPLLQNLKEWTWK